MASLQADMNKEFGIDGLVSMTHCPITLLTLELTVGGVRRINK